MGTGASKTRPPFRAAKPGRPAPAPSRPPPDISRFHGALAAVQEALATFNQTDILVNNAGAAIIKPLVDLTPEEWERVLATNLTGTYNLCRAAGPHMVRQRAGKEINIASVIVDTALPGYAAYAASK